VRSRVGFNDEGNGDEGAEHQVGLVVAMKTRRKCLMRTKSRSISLRRFDSSMSNGHGSRRFSFGGTTGSKPKRLRQVANLVAFVSAVHDQRDLQVVDAAGGEQAAADGSVAGLAWAPAVAEDLLEARGNQMNRGREATAAAGDGSRAPFFRARVPSGCTVMLVLSRLTTPILPRRRWSICSSSNTRSRTPAFAQRLMRVYTVCQRPYWRGKSRDVQPFTAT
jgi:hypothetical protein